MSKKINYFINFLLRNNKLHTFVLFFLLSAFLWFVSQMGKTYRYGLSVPVYYNNLPQDMLINPEMPDSLYLKIQASGYQILKNKILKPSIEIDYNKIHPDDKNQWQPVKNLHIIKEQLGNELIILQVSPETLKIVQQNNGKKQVPVSVRVSVHYKQGYKNSDTAQVTPDKIWIFGTSGSLKNIDTVYSKTYTFDKVDKDIDFNATLVIPEGVKTNIRKVRYHLPVSMFVEDMQKIDLRAVHVPASYTLIPFPGKVTVKFKVFKKDYGKINKNDFDVIIDYNNRFMEGKDTLLYVKPVKYPKQIFDLQILPEKIAFLLKKQI
jgi:hypothetical protein